jgi:hypothetical protein
VEEKVVGQVLARLADCHDGRAEDGPWYTLSREKVRYTKKEEDRRRATVNLNGPLSCELVL